MNLPIVHRMGYLLLLSTILMYCQPKDPGPAIVVREMDTDTLTLAQARAVNDRSVPALIYITDAGREGTFRIDLGDSKSADNTGVTLVTANGQRYKREYTGSAKSVWFGISTADTDIGPELQLALNSVSDLTLSEGSYKQETPARLRSNVAVRGNRAVISLTKSHISLVSPEDPKLPLENVLIDGLNWNVTPTATATYGVIAIDGPTVANLTIQNCTSTDAATESNNWLTLKVQAGKTARNILIQNNTVQAKRIACEIFNHDNYGIYAGRQIVIRENTFQNCGLMGISLSGPMDSLTIDKNRIVNCKLYGVEIAGALHNVRITNNTFEGQFDKFIEGSNDGTGPGKNGGTIEGGLLISNNLTSGPCTGGIQLFNAGAATFTNNKFQMTGRLELLSKSSSGGTYSGNLIETTLDHAIICDNAPDNVFADNTISNKNSPANFAIFRAYNAGTTNTSISNNTLIKGPGGTYYVAQAGAGSIKASRNKDENGNPIP